MDGFPEFEIPLTGMQLGLHQYHFDVDDAFFSKMEGNPLGSAKFSVDVDMHLHLESILFEFRLEGKVAATCDRCLAAIQLPIESTHELRVKMDDLEGEEGDLVYIPKDAHQIDISPWIYEFAVLSMPMSNRYDCESDNPRPCDMATLRLLEESAEESEEPLNDQTPTWINQLKNLNIEGGDK